MFFYGETFGERSVFEGSLVLLDLFLVLGHLLFELFKFLLDELIFYYQEDFSIEIVLDLRDGQGW